ncbi:unnamed protein product, partial [Meganyctiphanes norvegica]
QMHQAFKLTAESSIEHSIGDYRISVKDGRQHLHATQGKNAYKSPPYHLQFTDENDAPLTDGILTFLDIAWPDQEPRRVYMKMVGNTARARQHLLLVTGQCGHSYRNLQFYEPLMKNKTGEYIIIHPYDGDKAAPLLKDVTTTDVTDHTKCSGLMADACWDGDNNNALFGIVLRGDPNIALKAGFGQVTSGIEVLQDIAKSSVRDKITVVDCGVVIFW